MPTYHNGGSGTAAARNPFLYRGYYFDFDLKFYYLNSRYYDPYIGRFINADNEAVVTVSPEALTDKNLFAYCDNNPVMRYDMGGQLWNCLIGAVVGFGCAALFASMKQETGRELLASATKGAIEGAAAGLVTDFIGAFAISYGVKTIVMHSVASGIAGAVGLYVQSEITGEKPGFHKYVDEAIYGALNGALFGYLEGDVKGLMTNLPKSAGKTFCSQLWYAVKRTTKRELKSLPTTLGEGVLGNIVNFLSKDVPQLIFGGN